MIGFVARPAHAHRLVSQGIEKRKRIAYICRFVLWLVCVCLVSETKFLRVDTAPAGAAKETNFVAYGHSRVYFHFRFFQFFSLSSHLFSIFSFFTLFRRFNICHQSAVSPIALSERKRRPETKHFSVCRFHRLSFKVYFFEVFFVLLLVPLSLVLCERAGIRERDERYGGNLEFSAENHTQTHKYVPESKCEKKICEKQSNSLSTDEIFPHTELHKSIFDILL